MESNNLNKLKERDCRCYDLLSKYILWIPLLKKKCRGSKMTQNYANHYFMGWVRRDTSIIIWKVWTCGLVAKSWQNNPVKGKSIIHSLSLVWHWLKLILGKLISLFTRESCYLTPVTIFRKGGRYTLCCRNLVSLELVRRGCCCLQLVNFKK